MTIAAPPTTAQNFHCPHCRATFETVPLREIEHKTYQGYGYHCQARKSPSKCPSCGGELVNKFHVATINESVFKRLVDNGKNTNSSFLLGSWSLVARKAFFAGDSAEWVETPSNVTQLKHITPTHFSWVRFDMEAGSMVGAGGGTYSMDEDKYVELVQYVFGDISTLLLGKKQEFTWKIEGDTFHQSGRLSDGLYIEEKYVRAAKL